MMSSKGGAMRGYLCGVSGLDGVEKLVGCHAKLRVADGGWLSRDGSVDYELATIGEPA
jgi:hypothetical protein